jgi:hypothetical protein
MPVPFLVQNNQLSPLRQLCRLIKTPATDLTDLTGTAALNTIIIFMHRGGPKGHGCFVLKWKLEMQNL